MKLTKDEEKAFAIIADKYINNKDVLKLKDYCAHGKISVYEHSINVAKTAFKLNRKLKMNADDNTIVIGGILHDFYLYDWHNASIKTSLFKMHGYTHAKVACDNASKYFDIDDNIKEAISCHMWPLNITSIPKHKESILICIADKIVASKETLFQR